MATPVVANLSYKWYSLTVLAAASIANRQVVSFLFIKGT